MENIKICSYGCGKEAKHQFKNGKWCCNSHISKCSGFIKKRIGQKRSKESRKRMSNAQKDHIPWNKGKKTNQFNNWLGKHHTKESKEKIGISNKLTISKIKKRYPIFSKIEEMRYEPGKEKEKVIQVHCKNNKCKNSKEQGGWFTPLRSQLHERKRQIENKNGNDGSYLYCCDDCKQKCFQFYQKLTIEKIQEKYPTFVKIEEIRYNPDNPGEIQVHCKNHNCKNSKEQGGWFTPLKTFISERIRCIEHGNGGSYFYCCNECKVECPLYGKHATQLIKQDQIRAGHIENPWYNSQEYQTWRNQVFELDENKCVWCGKEAIVAHHILPQKTHPELSLDPENGISCCQPCHMKYGHRNRWCTTGFLAELVCKRIIRIKKKVKKR